MVTYLVQVVVLLFCVEMIHVSRTGRTTTLPQCRPLTGSSSPLGDLTEPETVPELGECTEILGETPQCCSLEYINMQKSEAITAIKEGLRTEASSRLESTANFYTNIQGATSFRTPFANRYLNCVFNKFDPFQITDEGMFSELSGQLRSIITCFLTTQCPSLLEGFLNMVEMQLKDSLIEFFQSGPITFNLRPEQEMCVAEIVTEVFFTEEVRQQHYNLLDNIRRTVANVAGKVRKDIFAYIENLAGFSPLTECITSLLQINTCQRCLSQLPDLCTNVCGQITAACYSAMNDRMVDELQLLWDFNRQISTILEYTLEAFTKTFPASINLTEFIEKLEQKLIECDADFSAHDIILFQIDNNCDFPELLPDTSLLPVSSDDGGLFDYPGRAALSLAPAPATCVSRISTVTSELCWNGEDAIPVDVEPFQNYTIAGQGENPLYIGNDAYIESLESQLSRLGFPFSPLLLNNPSFSSLLPTPWTPSTTVMATPTIHVTPTQISSMDASLISTPVITPSHPLPSPLTPSHTPVPLTPSPPSQTTGPTDELGVTLPCGGATSVEAAVLIILLPLLIMLLIIIK